MIRRLAILVFCVLAGCAARTPGSARPSAETPEAQEQAQRYDELRRLDDELVRDESQAAAPDCARIGQLRDNICALAARICQIADREPANSVASQRCGDGKSRCQRAVESAQARGCPKK
jgi:outer membrane murein-binding lipoprotein Lpp